MDITLNKDKDDYISADEWIPVLLDLIKEGRELKISPHGYSMYPFLASDRDEVTLKLITEQPKRGDIILYRRDSGRYVLHRIHHIKDHGYYMIGDSQNLIEGPLYREQLLAIATGFKRKGIYHSCNGKRYRTISAIWLLMIPIRRPIIRCWKKLQKLFKRKKNSE